MSQKQQFTNFAAGTLNAGITSGATTIVLSSGQGAIFPTLSGSQFFMGTLKNASSGYLEIVKVTARSSDTLTVVRGQENTTAAAFNAGDAFELRTTAAAFANLYAEAAQLDGAAFTGTVTVPTVTTSDNSTNVATTAFVKNQAYAPLASPTFTGTPAAPTATAGTNTTQVATTAFVTTAIANSALAGPTFSAYNASGNQTIPNNTPTKVTLPSEDWDTANAFDSTTNYRFQPTVAGYYRVSGCISMQVDAAASSVGLRFYKNGADWKRGGSYNATAGGSNTGVGIVTGSALVYLNGSTDYVEMWAFQNSGANATLFTGQSACTFQGEYVRGP